MSDAQVFIALLIAVIPGFLALRLGTELYKQIEIIRIESGDWFQSPDSIQLCAES